MIGIKDQQFGVEIEMTGITRQQAVQELAAYFETSYRRAYEKPKHKNRNEMER